MTCATLYFKFAIKSNGFEESEDLLGHVTPSVDHAPRFQTAMMTMPD